MTEPLPKHTPTPKQTYIVPPKQRSPVRRFGCMAAVVIWFMVLLAPCFCIVMATQGEIAVRLGDVPGQSFRIWLINESRQRGFGIARPSLVAGTENAQICLQTSVSFILWTGTAEAATYCECYTHAESAGAWQLMSSQQGACQP